MKRFFKNLKKYKNYIITAIKSELKSEITNSNLGWLLMIFEPLVYTLIYLFVAQVIFKSNVLYFPIFILIGISVWNFFSKMILTSIKLIDSKKDINAPKYTLLIVKMGINLIKMFISFIIVILFMLYYQVPITWNILWFLPIVFTIIIFTFGICSIILHSKSFSEYIFNFVKIILRVIFYLSGVFFDISTKVHNQIYRTILLDLNPVANFIYDLRNVLINNTHPGGMWTLIWFLISILICILGINSINKNEKI